jgi:hypothetical protein
LQHIDEAQEEIVRQVSDANHLVNVQSNQPIQNLNLSSNPVQATYVSGRRSPKDFLDHDTSF